MTAHKGTYKILVIEDNPGDFVLVESFLMEQIESPLIALAKSFKNAKELLLLEQNKYDIILLDLSLPDKKGEELISEIFEICTQVPIIVLTGYADFAFGVKSLSMGVSDYILKEELTSIALYKSIVYSSERKKVIAALEESEKRYNDLFHLSPLPMWVIDIESLQFLDVNLAAIRNYGYTHTEFLTMTPKDIRPAEDIPLLQESLSRKFDRNWAFLGIFRHQKKNGDIIQVDIQSNDVLYKGKKARIILANDITERLNYVAAIEKQNEKLKEIAWMQSHVVRAPLARIMGLIQIIKDTDQDVAETEKILEYILISAYELDDIIRSISDQTTAANYNV